MFLQQLVNGLTLGSLYAVLAIGLTLVFGVLNIINMAHGGIFMIGAFVGLFMVTVFDVNIFVALIVAMAVGAILGYLLEFVALRPLRKKKVSHLAPLISTIGVSIFLESLALLLWGPQTRSFPPDYIGGLIDFGAFKISMVQIIGLGVSIVLMLILNIVIKKTKIGKAIRAVSMSTETAALLGINPTMIISVTVMIASALGAAAGVLVGLSFNAIEPTMGVIIGFKGLAVLILGGLGNITGAMVGGFILGVAEIFSVAYGASTFRDAVAFGFIILLLFWRPQGLFGSKDKGGRHVMDLLNPYYLQIVMFFIINAIMGISIYFTLASGQLSLGAAGFMSVGAYVGAILSLKADLPIVLGIIIGGLVASLVAVIIGLPTTRLRGLYLAIATLGFGEVVRVIFLNLDITNGALGLSGIPSIPQELTNLAYELDIDGLMGIDAVAWGNLMAIIILLAILVLIIAFCVRINNSRVGRAFAAIKADDHAAELMGINVVYYKMMAFIIGAFIAGIGGGLYAHITNFINPTDFSYHKVVQILLFPVFGGSNVVWGSVLGSFILTLLPEVLRFLSDYRDIIYGALLVILMAVRPDGILTESMVDKISRKLGFKKAPYIPESQVLTERFEAYKRKQQEEKQG